MKKRIITIVLTAMLLVPTFSSNVYAAEKYFAVNRTENGYEAFQEDESQNIENSLSKQMPGISGRIKVKRFSII